MSDLLITRFETPQLFGQRTRPLGLAAALRTALRVYLTRRELPGLTARERADIGISALDAAQEAGRLPWNITPDGRGSGSAILGALQRAFERARTRRLLSGLQARELRDIGVSASDAQYEAGKAFWQV